MLAKKNLLIILLIPAFILSACQDDNEDRGTFEIALDGANKKVSVTTATLKVGNGQYSASGRGFHTLSISAMVEGETVTVLVSNWDFQKPPAKAIFVKDYYNVYLDEVLEVGEETETCMKVSDNQTVCEGVSISYTQGDKTFTSFSLEDDTVILSVKKCDGARISGTFDITLTNPHDILDITVIQGTFTNLPYTVRHL